MMSTVATTLLVFASLISFPTDGDSPFDVEFKKVQEGVYIGYRTDPVRIPVEGNVTVIVTDRDVIVVDSGGAPVSAEQTVRAIRELTDKPVSMLINTHGHGDHTLGTQVYAEAFPGLEILMHPRTRDYMLSIGMKGLGYAAEIASEEGVRVRQKQGRESLAQLDETDIEGKEVVRAYLNQYYQKDVYIRSAEYKKVNITGPTLTVTDSLTVYRGEQEIQILHLGFGNTASDLVVYLPRERVVIAGDVVTLPVPYGFSDAPVQWMATLGKLDELDFDILIPGHGDPLRGKEYLQLLRNLFASGIEQVRQGVEQGLTLEEIREQVDLSDFRPKFAKGNVLFGNRFDQWFAEPFVGRVFNELTGSKEE